MKTKIAPFIICSLLSFEAAKVLANGLDYPPNTWSSPSWPPGVAALVGSTNWVHGYGLNAEDFFFFAGSAKDFTSFLDAYSKIPGVEKHVLILHDGTGEARSPWGKSGRPCDWELFGCPKRWRDLLVLASQATNSTQFVQKASQGADYGQVWIGTNGQVKAIEGLQKPVQDTNYVLEVHFWTGGKITLDQVSIPKNVEISKPN